VHNLSSPVSRQDMAAAVAVHIVGGDIRKGVKFEPYFEDILDRMRDVVDLEMMKNRALLGETPWDTHCCDTAYAMVIDDTLAGRFPYYSTKTTTTC